MFLLAALLLGPEADRGKHNHSSRRGGSDWSWFTGSGRGGRSHQSLTSDLISASRQSVWGYSTKATQPGKKHGWFI